MRVTLGLSVLAGTVSVAAAQSSSSSSSSSYSYTTTGSPPLFAPTQAPLTGVVGNPQVQGDGSGPDADGKYTIGAEGITLQFVPYGASISNLWINDRNGVARDIVLGWDNATFYTLDTKHPHFGAVPGRYANRIKNSTFDIDGQTYHVLPNENNGQDTLHGGPRGWDWQNFTVTAHTANSITFSIADPDGAQGFPGAVVSYVTYTAEPYTWNIQMVAVALTKATPIMLSSHTYWNLDAFQSNQTRDARNHTIHLPYSGNRVAVDPILIPTGDFQANQKYSVNDFWSSPKQMGANLTAPEAKGNCGNNCTGYDTCYLVNRQAPYDWRDAPVATLRSEWSGIQVDVHTDQEAFQIFACNNYNDSIPVKKTQGYYGNGAMRTVPQYGCIVMEVEDYIDGINQPEWGRLEKQIFRPGGDPYVLQAKYVFSNSGGPALPYNGAPPAVSSSAPPAYSTPAPTSSTPAPTYSASSALLGQYTPPAAYPKF